MSIHYKLWQTNSSNWIGNELLPSFGMHCRSHEHILNLKLLFENVLRALSVLMELIDTITLSSISVAAHIGESTHLRIIFHYVRLCSSTDIWAFIVLASNVCWLRRSIFRAIPWRAKQAFKMERYSSSNSIWSQKFHSLEWAAWGDSKCYCAYIMRYEEIWVEKIWSK